MSPGGTTVVVADDEAPARRRLLELLGRRDDVRVVGECSTGMATLNTVRAVEPDLLFLDIQMPGLDGFEVLERLEPDERPVVVFCTAYDAYALDAFDVAAVDYLLKPFADDRFEQAVDRALRTLGNEKAGHAHDRLGALLEHVGRHAPAWLERFSIPDGDGFLVIDASAVDWIEASRDYVVLHTGDGDHLLRGTMASLERRLDPARFIRIHRSAIVRLERVGHVGADAHGDWVVEIEGGKRLRVGRIYRDEVLKRVGVRW